MMNPLNVRIKRILDDIIDVAYKNEDEKTLKRLHGFYVEILSKEMKNSSGSYFSDSRTINVYNPRLGARHMTKCCIHELSHHVDFVLNGKTGHKAPFYKAYTRLMYASLDMGILSRKDFYDDWSSDQNKVKNILNTYRPHKIEYSIPEGKIVTVKNCYKQKEDLKKSGYKWNSIEQVWEKAVEDVAAEETYLKSIGCTDYSIQNEFEMHVNAIAYIYASGKTFEHRDMLKENGFFYDKEEKYWKKKLLAEDVEKNIKQMEQIEGVIFDYTKPTKKARKRGI